MTMKKGGLSRRQAMFSAVAAGVAGLVGGIWWTRRAAPVAEVATLTAPEAFERVQAGQITLIDIRRPEEWAQTGSAGGAVRLDMQRKDFITALEAQVGGDRTAPIALICRTGNRSGQLSRHLVQAGFTGIMDVSEGMQGSKAGPGWISRGLPIDRN